MVLGWIELLSNPPVGDLHFKQDVVFCGLPVSTSCIFVTEGPVHTPIAYPPWHACSGCSRCFCTLFVASSAHMRRTLLLLEFQVTAVSSPV